jgi:hypothetical protein
VLPIFYKDKSGNILSEHGDILQRWRPYFCDLQSMNASSEELISENTILNNVEVPPPSYYEVNQVREASNTQSGRIGQYTSRVDKTRRDRTKTKDTQINNENMGRGDYQQNGQNE